MLALARMGFGFAGVKDLGMGVASTVDLAGRYGQPGADDPLSGCCSSRAGPAGAVRHLTFPCLENTTSKDILGMASLDVQRVIKDGGASSESKGQARCVEGLLLRNQGKYDDARKALAEALKVKVGPSRRVADGCRTCLEGPGESPTAYVLPWAEELQASGQREARAGRAQHRPANVPEERPATGPAQPGATAPGPGQGQGPADLQGRPGFPRRPRTPRTRWRPARQRMGSDALGQIAEATRDLARADRVTGGASRRTRPTMCPVPAIAWPWSACCPAPVARPART